MRIYIIGDDGITLCRAAPATVNDGEVAVASKEELHAAPLGGKRLLALWNALPGVGETAESWRLRGTDRSAVVGDRGLTGAGAAIGRKAHVKAGRRSRPTT